MSLFALPSEIKQPAKSDGDAMIEAIADAVAIRLERMAGTRQRLLDIHQAAECWACRSMRCGTRPVSMAKGERGTAKPYPGWQDLVDPVFGTGRRAGTFRIF